MLAPVAVHAHDETVFVLHAHLVVDVLLNAASEEPLQTENTNRGTIKALKGIFSRPSVCILPGKEEDAKQDNVFLVSPCSPRRRALRNGNQMRRLHTPYIKAPSLRSL